MIEEYSRVRIKASGITGIVIDTYEVDGVTIYTVESDKKDVQGGYGQEGNWKLFACRKEEIEPYG